MKGVFIISTIVAIAVTLLVVAGIGATVLITPAYAQGSEWRTGDGTGMWLGNDGGTYYLKHIGDVVWWIGLSGGTDGRTYSNVFRGTMTTQLIDNERITVINGEYVDVEAKRERPCYLESCFCMFQALKLYLRYRVDSEQQHGQCYEEVSTHRLLL